MRATVKDIDEVILVGGQTRMPRVHEIVSSFFGKNRARGQPPTGGARRCRGRCCQASNRTCCCSTDSALLGRGNAGACSRGSSRATPPFPAARAVFSTAVDNQPYVNVHVLQGDGKWPRQQEPGALQLTASAAPRARPRSRCHSTSIPTAWSAWPPRTWARARPGRRRAAHLGLSEAEIGSFIAESEPVARWTSPRRNGLTCPTAPTRSFTAPSAPCRNRRQLDADAKRRLEALWRVQARFELFVGDVARASAALSKLEPKPICSSWRCRRSMSEPEPSPEKS